MAATRDEAARAPVLAVEVGALLPRLDRDEKVLLLDVRNEEEFEAWKVEARRPVETVHVPYFDFLEDADASIAKVPHDREVVVLCAQGGSSETVAGMLQESGISSANIRGGMIAYGMYLQPVRVPLSAEEGARFEFNHPVTPLADGDEVCLGGEKGVSIQVRAIGTPGHTPGSTSYLVDGMHLLTGDTLFVASVGRPDLGGHVVEWGHALFDTLMRRLADLPGETRVLPAHYGSIPEISADGVVWGRLGDLRRTAPKMQIATAEAFVEAVRGAVKYPPRADSEIIEVNLGAPATEEKISEWESGKNQCAASARKASGA